MVESRDGHYLRIAKNLNNLSILCVTNHSLRWEAG